MFQEQLRRESQLYRDNLAELRKKREAQEQELEKILQEEKAKVDAERKERAMKLKAAREKLKNVSIIFSLYILYTYDKNLITPEAYIMILSLNKTF